MSDLVAIRLFEDNLAKAREILKLDLPGCSTLLCKLTIEQVLKRLCRRCKIKYEPTETTMNLNNRLRKPEGVFEKHEWSMNHSKILYANGVNRGDIEPKKDDVEELINWTEEFVERYRHML